MQINPNNLLQSHPGTSKRIIRLTQPDEADAWDTFVESHPHAGVYHLSGWREVIEKAYHHRSYYLAAVEAPNQFNAPGNHFIGLLPLVHMKHFLFGNNLVSMPYFDTGGVLARDEATAMALVRSAMTLGRDLKADSIELRHLEPLNFHTFDQHRLPSEADSGSDRRKDGQMTDDANGGINVATRSHKVRMILDLPESSEILIKSFKAKLRSQIKKPVKEGLVARIGGSEMIDDFYLVFAENMRDLGSPVHSKDLIASVLKVFPASARLIIVYKDQVPLACSMVIGFKQTLANPWASALRKFSGLSPNMLLYWTMLDYACREGYKRFDFGRSTPGEGTYKFKEQWGAQPQPCHWYYLSLKGPVRSTSAEKTHYSTMIASWKKLPVAVTRFVGPMIRKHIGL